MTNAPLLLQWQLLASDPPGLGHVAAGWRGWFLWASPNARSNPTSWNWGAKPPDGSAAVGGDAATGAAAMAAAEAALLAGLTGHERAELARWATVAAWNEFDVTHERFADEWNRDFMPESEDR